jgi:hypothetical protein
MSYTPTRSTVVGMRQQKSAEKMRKKTSKKMKKDLAVSSKIN